jgi:gamma-glutamyltranspeptidase/glutathione hydrolase
LSKAYARLRADLIDSAKNLVPALPGDPYPFEGKTNPFSHLLQKWQKLADTSDQGGSTPAHDQQIAYRHSFDDAEYMDRMLRGTTSVEAADKEGWVVSITPSGGWIPACIAGRTGIGLSQRMQSFVLDSSLNPFNVVAPGKRPRVTLTPSIALKDGRPFLSFAVQGGDTQDQNLLQFFLNVVEFGMNVQQAAEAANINTNQLWLSLGGTNLRDRAPKPGDLLLQSRTPEAVRKQLTDMGYKLRFTERTSGPINAIYFDWKHNSFWGGSSNHGEDYGIGW